MNPDEVAGLHADLVLATVDVAADRYREVYGAFRDSGLESKRVEGMTPAEAYLREDVIEARWDLTDSVETMLHDRYGILFRVEVV